MKRILTIFAAAFILLFSSCSILFDARAQNPSGENGAAVGEQVEGKDYFIYVAKWYDDLERIAEQFSIDKDILKAYNGMDSYQTTRRQKVRIPLHPESVVLPVQGEEPQAPSTEVNRQTPPEEESPFLPFPEFREEEKEAGLADLLKVRGESGTPVVGLALPFSTARGRNDAAFDFYSGLLLALKDLAEAGITVDLKVKDCSDSTHFDPSSFEGCDIIIGPLSPRDLERTLAVSDSLIPVVSPLDPKAEALAAAHHNFIHAPSPNDAQIRDIVEWIREDFRSGDRVFLMKESGADMQRIEQLLMDAGLEYKVVEYGILENATLEDKLTTMMSPIAMNHAIVISDKEAFVNDALRNLTIMTYKEIPVTMYAPSRIRNFETLDVESLHNVSAHVSCSYHVNYDSPKVKAFLPVYRALYHAEPTPFAYQGYDTAMYFIRRMAIQSEDEDDRAKGLQSDFLFSEEGREPGSGYINSAVRRVIYGPDFEIITLSR